MSETYDVVIIGGGPGGYNCAIRAAQLGLRTAIVEDRGKLGGTCLNVGCIPSKALLHSSDLYEAAHTRFKGLGIRVDGVTLDLAQMMRQKDEAVDGLTKGVEFLMRKNKVDYVKARGRLASPGKVDLEGPGERRVLDARNVVLATGSIPADVPGVAIDEDRIVSSTGALSLKRVPSKLIVIGGGYIGLELGSVWRRLGSEVTVVEFLDRIAPGMDEEISAQFLRTLKKQGMRFELGAKVVAAEKNDAGVRVMIESARGSGEKRSLDADVVLVAVGRKAYTENLGPASNPVKLDRGIIQTDHEGRTNVQGVWAIGDCISGPMLAHKAEEEGIAVAQRIAGRWGHVNYGVIPGVIYTNPEVASVGKTEQELKAAGTAYKVGKFPFAANSRARTNHEADGFVKIIEDDAAKRIVGAHLIGPGVGELIAELCVAMEFGASAEDVARTCHAHPTMGEAVREAAKGVDGWIMQA
jgi:dihydrolipoamide dehydrogenase